ncbi:hypothetical protein DH86_00002217 [Scytalidium sp. 3C]|nr:hypothetical protein DH86_00002217 [Scytalidium sp. 3C]
MVYRQALNNIKAVLEAAGSGIDNVVKVNIFITTMDNYAEMNKVYEEFFTKEPKPVSLSWFIFACIFMPEN